MIRVGIVGHDPYTIPLLEGLNRQPDIHVVGAYSHKATPYSKYISRKVPVYCSRPELYLFKQKGVKVSGFLEDFIEETDAFLEYDCNQIATKVSYRSSGITIRPYEVLLERLSMALPIKDLTLEEIHEDLVYCPYFKVFKVSLNFIKETYLDWIRDSLLTTPRTLVISGEGIYLQDLCIFLPTTAPYSNFSINVLMNSIKIREKDKKAAEFISLFGYMSSLPETVDTLRESEGVKREFSQGITDEHLSIKRGLIL